MANFQTHVTFSTVLGVGYAGAGMLAGAPVDTSLVAGGLCGISGMLPDIDSGPGRPLRESMGFAAAVIPMMLIDRFQQLGLTPEMMVLVGGAIYFSIRFGMAAVLRKFSVHRGMWHSIPVAIVFAEVAFLMASRDLGLRYYKAGGVLLGVMSHLLLDEIYSVQMTRGRVKLKSSFGTAIKFWGKSMAANVVAYALLIGVTAAVLGEPMMMDALGKPAYQDYLEIARERAQAAETAAAQAAENVLRR